MARIKLTLARALVLYLALLPLLGLRAEAQGAKQSNEAQSPTDPRGPMGPRTPGPGDTTFTPLAEPVTVRAFNGFTSNATPGMYSHSAHDHAGGVATFDSPWGEQMKLRFWQSPHGLTFEYDDELKVRYIFDEAGRLDEIVAETAERQERMQVGRRAELAYLGQADPESFDLAAYALIEEALRAKHSDAFLDSLGQFDGAAKASCFTQGVQCVTCLISWAASVAAIASACLVGGVPTMGTACFLAILAHETLNFSCAATCAEWIQDCFGGRAPGQRIPDGCEF